MELYKYDKELSHVIKKSQDTNDKIINKFQKGICL